MIKKYVIYTISLQGRVMYVGVTKDFTLRKTQHLKKIGRESAIPTDVDTSMITIEKIKEYTYKKSALKEEDRLIVKYNTINSGWNKNRSGNICTDMKKYSKNYYSENRDKIRNHQKWYRKYVLGIGM